MPLEPTGWTLEPHICRSCFGRLLSKPDPATGGRFVRCSNCGAATLADAEGALKGCCCSLRVGKRGERDAGLRCVANPSRTPDSPSEIIAKEMG